MKKRIIAIIAFTSMLISTMPMLAFAAMSSSPTMSSALETPPLPPTISNFTKLNNYISGMFIDVNEVAWYGFDQQKSVANAYEYGLMQGSGGTFNPDGYITIAEAVSIAAKVRNIYINKELTGFATNKQDSPWYQGYVEFAIVYRIITATDFDDNYTRAATRAEMAYIFSSALPKDEFTEINTVNSIPDVDNDTLYSEAVFLLYRAGVINGYDTQGTFNSERNITRAEAAAIISRVILPNTRISGMIYE